jgi:predicted RNA binding protein YcfA (HicA-like mRNA interferase family)
MGKIINKELAVLIKQAEKQGWQVEYTKGGHYKWITPRGNFFFSASTPSDPRAIDNIKRDLRVNGLITITKKGRR